MYRQTVWILRTKRVVGFKKFQNIVDIKHGSPLNMIVRHPTHLRRLCRGGQCGRRLGRGAVGRGRSCHSADALDMSRHVVAFAVAVAVVVLVVRGLQSGYFDILAVQVKTPNSQLYRGSTLKPSSVATELRFTYVFHKREQALEFH